MVFVEFGEFCSLCNGLVESAEFINEFDFQRVLTRENVALRVLLDLLHRHFPTVGHALAEQFVAAIDVALQKSEFLGIERTRRCTEVRVFVRFHLVEFQSEFLRHQFRAVGQNAENADGTCQRGGFGENIVGSATDVVAARRRISAHRNDNRLLRLQLLDLMPDLLRSVGTAARRIHANDNRFHVFVVGEFLKVFVHFVAHNLVASAYQKTLRRRIDNVAVSVIDGNLLALLLLLHVLHRADAHLVDFLVLVDVEQLLHLRLHLVVVEQFIDKFHLLQSLRALEHHKAVGVGVQRVGIDFAALAHGFHHIVPNARDEGGHLLAVRVAHAVFGVHFGRTLVFSNLHNLHLHAHFLQQILHKHRLGSDAVPIDLAARIQIDLVGHRAKVVSSLRIAVAVGHDPLARLLEILERVANFLHLRVVGTESASLDVDAFHLVVFLGFFDGGKRLLQAHSVDAAAHEQSHHVLACLFLHLSREIHHENRVVAYVLRGTARGNHANQTHHSQNGHQQAESQQTNHRRQHILKEIFHIQ